VVLRLLRPCPACVQVWGPDKPRPSGNACHHRLTPSTLLAQVLCNAQYCEAEMSLTDWNWLLPRDNQDYAWDCAACSTAWALRTIGFAVSEQDVIAGLGPGRISPTYGLLDASGAGLVSYLGELGVQAENNGSASFDDVMAAAGYQPMVIGGRAWCHWVAVRMGSAAAAAPVTEQLLLMNPAPGYMGMEQVLYRHDFDDLGPFSAVWFTSW